MLLTIVLLLSLQIVATWAAVWILNRRLRRRLDTAIEAANVEINKLIAGEPCQTATILNAVGSTIGAAAGRSAKASIMADLSHIKRTENNEAASEQLSLIGQQSPGLGAALMGMGTNKSTKMLKNPLVQIALQAFLGGGGIHRGDNSGGANSGGSSVLDRIKQGQ